MPCLLTQSRRSACSLAFHARDLVAGIRFAVEILERHPFTTQTFCPLGLASGSTETYYLVIVAPSLENPIQTGEGGSRLERPPDLNKLRAFIAHGGQAVTYAPGTWHAPMVVPWLLVYGSRTAHISEHGCRQTSQNFGSMEFVCFLSPACVNTYI